MVKDHCGGVHHNRQPLAKTKSVYREVESEGRSRQISVPRNTNQIRLNMADECAKQHKVHRLWNNYIIEWHII